MQIEPLRHHLGLVSEIANTLNQSWGDLPPWSTTDKIRDRLLAGTGDADFPRVLVALGESGTFAATLSEYAFARGVQALYLYTPDQQSLYARLGWTEVSTETVNHEVVSIMVLSSGPSAFRAEPHSQD